MFHQKLQTSLLDVQLSLEDVMNAFLFHFHFYFHIHFYFIYSFNPHTKDGGTPPIPYEVPCPGAPYMGGGTTGWWVVDWLVGDTLQSGAKKIAVVGAIMNAKDPRAACLQLLEKMQ